MTPEKAHELPANPSAAWILKKVHFPTCSHHEGVGVLEARRAESGKRPVQTLEFLRLIAKFKTGHDLYGQGVIPECLRS